MSDGTADDLKRRFDEADTDKNGSISEEEFAKLVAALGVKFGAGQLQTAFMAIDINGNGHIDFGEFKSWWTKR
jgi:calcium-binding protein CML